MKRRVLEFNRDWLYCPQDRPSYARRHCSELRFERVCLPHTNVELPHHNFDNRDYQFISWYRKHFTLPLRWQGRRLFLDFDGVMMAAEVFVNGRRVATHRGGYVPFCADITEHVRFGAREGNVVSVRVDSRERPDIPPYGGVADYLTFGGIYRDVRLRAVCPLFIEDICTRPRDVMEPTRALDVLLSVRNTTGRARSAEAAAELCRLDGTQLARSETATVDVPPGGAAQVAVHLRGLKGIRLWELDSPELYLARAWLSEGGRSLDEARVRFGFRDARFTESGGFKLNGRTVKLRGLNRHQTFPYVGAAAPARLQRRDADILKFELGLNIVRTSHYPQSPHFLDRCDEIGLLVFEEMPGWQHIGDAAWKRIAFDNLRGMIVRDRNHPSVVLWGVRINESADDHAFYVETNRIAHELDPTRQTGGVRCIERSELLEDVYTMNDFTHSGGERIIREPEQVTGLSRHVAYLVSEFNGHMYPAKPWDNEERLVEHALRHARVQDAIAGHPHISGGIGWCAFDYNTHREFGSGDRICYHGVCDIFRLPKFAAWLYESQLDPRTRPVLRVASRWKLGERSGGGVEPLVVFSNCDRIEVYVGPHRRGSYRPAKEQFPNLPHPPFICTGIGGVWGSAWEDLRVVGYVGRRRAAEQRIAADGVPQQLLLWADDTELIADGADMTRIAFAAADRYGNPLPYANLPVTLTARGPGKLVGENPFCLEGGVGALYLRAGRRAGIVTVTASARGLPARSVSVRLRAARMRS